MSRVMTRATYRPIGNAAMWSTVFLDDNLRRELIWWLLNINEVFGFTMKANPRVLVLSYHYVFHGDASGTGVFMGMIKDQRRTLLSQPFAAEECLKCSTF